VGCIAERTGLTPPGIIALHQINTEMTVSICVSIQTRYHCLHAAAAAAAVGDGSIAVGLASSGAADRFVGVFPRARQAVVVAFEGQRAILSQRLSTVGRRGSWPWWRRWWGRGYGRQRSPDGLFIARFRLLCANLVRHSLTDGCRGPLAARVARRALMLRTMPARLVSLTRLTDSAMSATTSNRQPVAQVVPSGGGGGPTLSTGARLPVSVASQYFLTRPDVP
jgi:hypothetical protein